MCKKMETYLELKNNPDFVKSLSESEKLFILNWLKELNKHAKHVKEVIHNQ